MSSEPAIGATSAEDVRAFQFHGSSFTGALELFLADAARDHLLVFLHHLRVHVLQRHNLAFQVFDQRFRFQSVFRLLEVVFDVEVLRRLSQEIRAKGTQLSNATLCLLL